MIALRYGTTLDVKICAEILGPGMADDVVHPDSMRHGPDLLRIVVPEYAPFAPV